MASSVSSSNWRSVLYRRQSNQPEIDITWVQWSHLFGRDTNHAPLSQATWCTTYAFLFCRFLFNFRYFADISSAWHLTLRISVFITNNLHLFLNVKALLHISATVRNHLQGLHAKYLEMQAALLFSFAKCTRIG